MTVAGPRNPSRTREFYETRILSPEVKPIVNGTVANVTTSVAPPAVASSSSTDAPYQKQLSTTSPVTVTPVSSVRNKASAAAAVPTTNAPPLIGMFNNMWDGVRGMLGINRPTCLNGGKPGTDGKCHCPKYFEGSSCERKVCLNGGTLTKVTVGQVSYECRCLNPLYIQGVHCENVHCSNDVPLIRDANNSWSCDCSQRLFYKGVFCEKFSPPIGIAIPVVLALIFLLCCGLCRIDWCPRKQPDRRRSRDRNAGRSEPQRRRQQQGRNGDRTGGACPQRQNPAQEILLPGDRAICSRNPVAFPAHGNPYIIRLDTIPTFNPNMIGGVDPIAAGAVSSKPIEPPPSYEQAIQAPPAPEPPRYSEHPDTNPHGLQGQPPPPNRHPPTPPT